VSRSDPLSESIEIGIVILVVVLGAILFIIQWISAWISANWSAILFFIEIVGSIIIIAAILYAIYYFRNYDEIQREKKQRQMEIDERAKEIRREIRDSGIDYHHEHEQKRYPITKHPVRSRHIPTSVKKEVWERDGGKCVLCGSSHDLEWDHEIPFNHGGSNTTKNIRILCKRCNRKKSGKIE
jgi:5-methylcytosine-specific restriction endonuclease McrA